MKPPTSEAFLVDKAFAVMLNCYIMNEMKIVLPRLECKRCGHTWHPRHEEMPVRCPKCGNPYWNKEKRVRGEYQNEG